MNDFETVCDAVAAAGIDGSRVVLHTIDRPEDAICIVYTMPDGDCFFVDDDSELASQDCLKRAFAGTKWEHVPVIVIPHGSKLEIKRRPAGPFDGEIDVDEDDELRRHMHKAAASPSE